MPLLPPVTTATLPLRFMVLPLIEDSNAFFRFAYARLLRRTSANESMVIASATAAVAP
jgi:hypothetical protein